MIIEFKAALKTTLYWLAIGMGGVALVACGGNDEVAPSSDQTRTITFGGGMYDGNFRVYEYENVDYHKNGITGADWIKATLGEGGVTTLAMHCYYVIGPRSDTVRFDDLPPGGEKTPPTLIARTEVIIPVEQMELALKIKGVLPITPEAPISSAYIGKEVACLN